MLCKVSTPPGAVQFDKLLTYLVCARARARLSVWLYRHSVLGALGCGVAMLVLAWLVHYAALRGLVS
jgi:hypothetical protein